MTNFLAESSAENIEDIESPQAFLLFKPQSSFFFFFKGVCLFPFTHNTTYIHLMLTDRKGTFFTVLACPVSQNKCLTSLMLLCQNGSKSLQACAK